MSTLHPIGDDELLLYHYKDGLDPARIAEIEDALFASTELRERYDMLQRSLALVDRASPATPDAGFEQRLWRALEPRIDAVQPMRPASDWGARWRELLAGFARPRAAFAGVFALLVAVGIGYYAGRSATPPGPASPTPQIVQADPDVAAARVLDSYVAAHLRATEGLLLTASNSDSTEILAGNRDLAAALVDSNRLYALAAARAGDLRLADFLRQLEPLLLDLANRAPDSDIQDSEGLREYLRKTDLLFQVRATQAQMAAAGSNPT